MICLVLWVIVTECDWSVVWIRSREDKKLACLVLLSIKRPSKNRIATSRADVTRRDQTICEKKFEAIDIPIRIGYSGLACTTGRFCNLGLVKSSSFLDLDPSFTFDSIF